MCINRSIISYSKGLHTVILELLSNESLSKDHFYIHSLSIEDKYDLIRMESMGLLRIEKGIILANAALFGMKEYSLGEIA